MVGGAGMGVVELVLVCGVVAEGADEDGGCLWGSVGPQGECGGLVVLFWNGDLVWVIMLPLEVLKIHGWVGVVMW